MPSGINRLGRAVVLVLRPIRSFGLLGKLVFVILTLAGVTALAFWKKAFLAWVGAEWTHAALLFTGLASIFCFIAALSALKQVDDLAVVRVALRPSHPPTLHAVVNRPKEQLCDVLRANIDLSFRNSSSLAGAAFFPRIELWSRRTRFSRWRNIPLQFQYPSGRWNIKGTNIGDLWHENKRVEVKARDEAQARLSFMAVAPQDPGVFNEYRLELRIVIDVLGQEEETIRIPLKSVERVSVPLNAP
jgi:hypothetical protein